MNLWDTAKQIPHGTEVLIGWIGSGGQVVDRETAQSRANICLVCEHNQEGSKLTESVALAIRRYLEVKNKLKLRVNGEQSLKTCEICTCVLRLQVHEPQAKVQSELYEDEKSRLPGFCWKLK